MPAWFRLTSPRSRPAALATIDLWATSASELSVALESITESAVDIGAISLRSLAGVDTGLVLRPTQTNAILMPHGGPAVIGSLLDTLAQRGLLQALDEPNPAKAYPEASNAVEAAALAALARSASPLAVDLLLAQAERWFGVEPRHPDERDHRLRRLIDPPLVVVVGPPNVGKSSLLNALAGRETALVDDAPGTTLDHIGAMIDLAGLVVRWVDTPGRRDASGLESDAIGLAEAVAAQADLVIAAADAGHADPRTITRNPPGLVIATRADMGLPGWVCDLAVSVKTGDGVAGLVAAVREKLVPAADLASVEPWVFCDDPASASGGSPGQPLGS